MKFLFGVRKWLLMTLLLGGVSVPTYAQVFLRFPTDNQALLNPQKPQDFYMYVDRNFEGLVSKPWEGGTYGFTRTIVRTQAGLVATKFHEGIDIKPIKRDANNEPLDEVRPVLAGKVVHVSAISSHSNYGRYVVIEHRVADGVFYSLYAHLGTVTCQVGEQVGTGNKIGILGYTGAGINKERAHLHLELCLMLQDEFEGWYKSLKFATPNRHGNYNGLNLAGFDVAPILKECAEGKPFHLGAYIKSLPVHYIVRVPAKNGMPDILKRLPFLAGSGPKSPKSWEISLTGGGVPTKITPSAEPCDAPVVISAKSYPFTQLYRTVKRVSGSGKAPKLTDSGKRYIKLICQDFE